MVLDHTELIPFHGGRLVWVGAVGEEPGKEGKVAFPDRAAVEWINMSYQREGGSTYITAVPSVSSALMSHPFWR